MLFPTITFAVFLLLVFTASWALMPRFRLWKLFMLVVSCVFYALLDGRFVALLLVLGAANWLFSVLIGGSRDAGARRVWVTLAVVFDLLVLGWFKYYGFFAQQLADVLGVAHLSPPLPLLQIMLPVGISFLVFRLISYVVDVSRGTLAVDASGTGLLDLLLYTAFWPYLLAGPIARARDFLPQLGEPRDPRRIDAARAFWLIFAGLAKKMILADYLATHLVNGVFTTPGQYTSLETLLGIVGYSVQIYCDFSAYSDIAIGSALLLGFELPDNFEAPYTARTVQDFWRRWHITLSSWIRDYIYIPLGGSRRGRRRTYINLMATMLLAGLWHGAAWTFVFWGGLHGAGLCIGRARREDRRIAGRTEPADTAWRVGRQRFLTFAFVSFAWIFFRADSFAQAWRVIAQLFRGWGSVGSQVTATTVLVIAVGIGIQYVPKRVTLQAQAGFSRLAPAAQGLGVAAALFVLNVLGPLGPAPFLYFRF